MTNSRGSSLALGTALLYIVMRAKRRALTLAALAICLGGVIYMMRATYLDRMNTLADVRGERSANSRLVQGRAALNVWLDNPVTGVGFGGRNYIRVVQRYLEEEDQHVAHNSYLQMLADSGIFAFAIYMWLLFGTIYRLGKVARSAEEADDDDLLQLHQIARALQCSLLAFAVGSTFYSFQQYDFFYILLLASGTCLYLAREHETTASDPEPDSLEALPAETLA